MPLDTRIALTGQPLQLESPLAQYGQLMNVMNARTQNQLAQMQISAAQQAAAEESGAKNYLGTADLNTPEGQRGLLAYGKTGLGYAKAFADQKKASLDADEATAKILGLAQKNFASRYSPLAAAAGGEQGVAEYVDAMYKDSMLGPLATKVKPKEKALADNLAMYKKDPQQWVIAHANLEGQQLLEALRAAEARAAETRQFSQAPVAPHVATPTAPVNAAAAPMASPTQAAVPLDRLNVAQNADGTKAYYLNNTPISEAKFAELYAASAAPVPLANTRAASLASMASAAAAAAPTPPVAPAAAPMVPTATAPVVAKPDVLNNLSLQIQGIQEQRNRLLPDIGKSAAVKAQWEDLGKQIEDLKKSSETASRLAFDREKFAWEKANPGKTIKEVTQGGVTKFFAINDRTGDSTPVTIAGGKILTGTDMASQRLAFDQAKFAWEKSNPGFTIQQTEDGSIVGVNNRTLQAYPVTLNAGTPPSPAPFTSVGGAAPSAGGGRGSVGVTDGRLTPTAPAVAPAAAPAGMPLKGKTSGLTESQGNATAFGMRMKESHDLLTGLEKSGATDTGIARGVIGGTLGLTPLIGDKLDDATGNIFNALPTVLGGLNEKQQQTVNARINFITAVLRKESGASISPGEFATAEKLYFPKPGDPKSVIEQKQKARETAIQAMKIQAGPGGKNIGATSESDPLGIRK